MSRAIVVKVVKEIAHARGRRVSRGYVAWLDRLLRSTVERDCHRLRGTVTLYAEDAIIAAAGADPRRVRARR